MLSEPTKKSLKPGLFVEEAGIFISSCGFLGASPDGVACSGEKTIKLTEVKCPYSTSYLHVPLLILSTEFQIRYFSSYNPSQMEVMEDLESAYTGHILKVHESLCQHYSEWKLEREALSKTCVYFISFNHGSCALYSYPLRSHFHTLTHNIM